MKLCLALLLVLGPSAARAQQSAPLLQASDFDKKQTLLLAKIARWRSDYLYNPHRDPELESLSQALKSIEHAAATATSLGQLESARKRLEAWSKRVLAKPYAEAKARGMKGESYSQFVLDRTYTVDYYAAQSSELELGLRAVSRLRDLYLKNPDGVFAGGPASSAVPVPRPRPVICAPSRLMPHPPVPARYAKARAQLVKEGADAVVVDNVIHHALAQKIDPLLFLALIKKESHFDPQAVSRAGARGLGQVMPATGRGLGVHDECKLQDIETNLNAASRYLGGLWRQFVGRQEPVAKLSAGQRKKADMALGAYNAGPTAVARHHGVPPFPETRDYVHRIWGYYQQLKKLTP